MAEANLAEPGDRAAPTTVPHGALRRMVSEPLAACGLVIVGLVVAVALAAPLLAHDPVAIDPLRRLASPSWSHPLGTDELGRDLWSRVAFGARWSLAAVALATALILTVGITAGAIAGWSGGVLDTVLMRAVDAILAFPGLLLAIALAGMLGPGIGNAVLAIVAVWWAGYARIARGLVLGLRERPFIEAARAAGASNLRIVLVHVIPNVLPPLLVLVTVEMGELLLALAGLDFLGLGAQPPAPEWGAMINQGRAHLLTAPSLLLVPGVAIALSVLGFNLLGDGLRDALDPRLR